MLTQKNDVTFNDIPALLIDLREKVDLLCSQLPRQQESDSDRLMTIEELMVYLPDHPARQTVYQWATNRSIPYEKFGRRLYFRKSDVDTWLGNGRRV